MQCNVISSQCYDRAKSWVVAIIGLLLKKRRQHTSSKKESVFINKRNQTAGRVKMLNQNGTSSLCLLFQASTTLSWDLWFYGKRCGAGLISNSHFTAIFTYFRGYKLWRIKIKMGRFHFTYKNRSEMWNVCEGDYLERTRHFHFMVV